MKIQILFSRKNKKNIINLPSDEFAHSLVSVTLAKVPDITQQANNVETMLIQRQDIESNLKTLNPTSRH